MEHKCTKCGGELVTGRLMTGAHLIGFTSLEDEKNLSRDMQELFAIPAFNVETSKIFMLKSRNH